MAVMNKNTMREAGDERTCLKRATIEGVCTAELWRAEDWVWRGRGRDRTMRVGWHGVVKYWTGHTEVRFSALSEDAITNKLAKEIRKLVRAQPTYPPVQSVWVFQKVAPIESPKTVSTTPKKKRVKPTYRLIGNSTRGYHLYGPAKNAGAELIVKYGTQVTSQQAIVDSAETIVASRGGRLEQDIYN